MLCADWLHFWTQSNLILRMCTVCVMSISLFLEAESNVKRDVENTAASFNFSNFASKATSTDWHVTGLHQDLGTSVQL